METQIFVPGTLNIFTDASVLKLKKGGYTTCSGAIKVYYNEHDDMGTPDVPIFRIIKDNSTNNIGELTGIDIAVDIAIQEQYNYGRINIFSDSKLCVFSLRDWIWKWVRIMKEKQYECLMTSTGTPVLNQVLIMNIVNKINMITNCQLAIYHQKGHVTDDKIWKAINVFKKTNNMDIRYFDALAISKYNNDIDQATRKALYSIYKHEDCITIPTPFCISPPDMGQYYHIMMRREFL